MSDDLLFSVIVPTRGDPAKLGSLLEALTTQTYPRDRFEIVVSFDGATPAQQTAAALARIGARAVTSPERRGPGAARNLAAAESCGAYLAFTEDDCVPGADWLANAAARLEREPVDVLEGATVRPDGHPTRRVDGYVHYLPTNLFVRRNRFASVGGYCEKFFDPKSGVYFREDSDLGFALEESGARIAWEPSARVTHPIEHPGYFDPLRWARRYEMDGLLSARHPRQFRARIEVHRWGPLAIRRPFVRACFAYVLALLSAGIALLIREPGLAALFTLIAAIFFLPIWAKWRFNPLRLPVLVLVPFVLVDSLIRGLRRA
jgi:glycosyltransferase involved in cell wall biosynthesis